MHRPPPSAPSDPIQNSFLHVSRTSLKTLPSTHCLYFIGTILRIHQQNSSTTKQIRSGLGRSGQRLMGVWLSQMTTRRSTTFIFILYRMKCIGMVSFTIFRSIRKRHGIFILFVLVQVQYLELYPTHLLSYRVEPLLSSHHQVLCKIIMKNQ